MKIETGYDVGDEFRGMFRNDYQPLNYKITEFHVVSNSSMFTVRFWVNNFLGGEEFSMMVDESEIYNAIIRAEKHDRQQWEQGEDALSNALDSIEAEKSHTELPESVKEAIANSGWSGAVKVDETNIQTAMWREVVKFVEEKR